jgi:hypothetical protein
MSVPSSVIFARELPEIYIFRYCHVEQPADADHFFPHRASGGSHLKSRCRACEKRYRDELAAARERVLASCSILRLPHLFGGLATR